MSGRPRTSGLVPGRRGFATLLVFLVVVFGAIIVSMVQTASYGQAVAGREALARVRATWAARAGVEMALARLEQSREQSQTGAYDALDSMADAAEGELRGATWFVGTTEGDEQVPGPADAASKINLGRMTREQLLSIEPFMGEDAAAAIEDWLDSDDDVRQLGAESSFYRGLDSPIQPRNAMPRSIAELELIAGVDPRDVRGEDWNLNNVLDPNEDDGDASWPPDNADGRLDRAWSGIITVTSVEEPRGPSGEPKLELRGNLSESDLVNRLGVSNQQAKAIMDHLDANANASPTTFVREPLPRIAVRDARRRGATRQELQQLQRMRDLNRDQLGKLLEETTALPAQLVQYVPGRLNINTCDARTLSYIPEIAPEVADAIVAERSARAGGFTNLAELLDVPGMTRQILATVAEFLCVRSNVYVMTSKGRDEATGLEVEMIATLDASTLPAVLKEVRVR